MIKCGIVTKTLWHIRHHHRGLFSYDSMAFFSEKKNSLAIAITHKMTFELAGLKTVSACRPGIKTNIKADIAFMVLAVI